MLRQPLAADYPGVSPYADCAGDPVNLVDIDGKRFRKVRHLNRITIYANYIALDRESFASAKQGVAFWNNRINDTYTDSSGNRYSIKYKLTVSEFGYGINLNNAENTYEINDATVDKHSVHNSAGITINKSNIHACPLKIGCQIN